MLSWVFGGVKRMEVHLSGPSRAAGALSLKRALVRWYLSIEKGDVPSSVRAQGKTTHRSLTVDGTEVELSDGFTELHTAVYRDILQGRGFGIEEARPSVTLAHQIRQSPIVRSEPELVHPFVTRNG